MDLRDTSCLVLGAGGFIGSHLCQALVRAGAQVHGFGRRPAFDALPPRMRMTIGEFGDRAALALALDGAEIVFHLLGGTNPEVSNKDPVADLQVNAIASISMIELCRAAGVRRLVFISSGGAVYGVPHSVPIGEDAPTQPISAYGINKLMLEKYLQLYGRLGGASPVILRVANPFGPYQSPFRRQGLIAAMIETVLAGRNPEIWGDGQVVRDYLYVQDVAEAMLAAARYEGPQQVFNIGSGTGRSVLDVLDSVCRLLGRERPPVTFRPARKADVPANVLDVGLAHRELGWSTQVSWEEGVQQTAAWISRTYDCSV